MCGIVGAASRRDIVPALVDGLRRLEYRGYDSAGISVQNGGGILELRRCVGKIRDLEKSLGEEPLSSPLGIGHTRWATHGSPNQRNAHPHLSNDCVAVVHNGIVENHETLRAMLRAQGYDFQSDTDTEVIAHLVHHHLMRTGNLFASVQAAVEALSGAYALAVIAASNPGRLVVTRRHSPLVIGIAHGEQFVASDPAALRAVTQRFMFLDEGDIADIWYDDISIADIHSKPVAREIRTIDSGLDAADKGPYRHYMLKEIHEQPQALNNTMFGTVANGAIQAQSLGFKAQDLINRVRAVHLVACGTSYHAAEVGRYWMESIAGIPCNIDLASEYRYRSPAVLPDCLFIAISQSGETADTLAAQRFARTAGYLATLSVCNVPESSMVREADLVLLTRAGQEVGVASTKTFTCQLAAMLMLAILFGQRKRESGGGALRDITADLAHVGKTVEGVLQLDEAINVAAGRTASHSHVLYLARGQLYPIAREGALKMKEISYIHAEAHAAGELKHGPLALVDGNMLVIALAPSNANLEKIQTNLREVRARGGNLLIFADAAAGIEPGPDDTLIEMPQMDDVALPIGYTVALQLLAYHAARARGTEIDQPRNLAKSVTVE